VIGLLCLSKNPFPAWSIQATEGPRQGKGLNRKQGQMPAAFITSFFAGKAVFMNPGKTLDVFIHPRDQIRVIFQ
jgi:hypothetical protein